MTWQTGKPVKARGEGTLPGAHGYILCPVWLPLQALNAQEAGVRGSGGNSGVGNKKSPKVH